MLRRLFISAAITFLLLLTILTIIQTNQPLVRSQQHFSEDEIEQQQAASTGLVTDPHDVDPNAWRNGDSGQFKEPKVESKTLFPVGWTKPPGSNYTKCLVMPTMKDEGVDWIDERLGDMLESGLLLKAVYSMDDEDAALRPIQNKGNEVMAYLSYIIDHYETLPDVAIFMHSHQYAWHNNLILEKDAALMVRHLSSERVTRDGYMNMRCHWDPGCPDWLHTEATDSDELKKEQAILAKVWPELFPGEQTPTVLAQPCCAQFAVSRERIRMIPKDRFVALRDWVLQTDLSDFLSGRIFEYTWQYIFTNSPFHCPSMSVCYCDGYGLCFGGPEEFDYYFELNYHLDKQKDELQLWTEKAEAVALAQGLAVDGRLTGEEMLEVPEAGRDVGLKQEIKRLGGEMRDLRDAAFQRGKDPKQRDKEAGRTWLLYDG